MLSTLKIEYLGQSGFPGIRVSKKRVSVHKTIRQQEEELTEDLRLYI